MTDFTDRLDVIGHLIASTECDRQLMTLILEELRVLRGKTDESARLIEAVRESTR